MRIFPVLFWILLKGYFHGLAALELTGPEAVSGLWGRSVSVPCQYHEGYQETPKYWCSGITWQSCSKVVETTGSEAEVTRGRVSIRDNHTLRVFTVTLENLTLGFTGRNNLDIIAVTTGSEAIVKHDRVSIKDIHTFCMFIVTMKNLTEKDSGTYWCGIDKLGLDLMFSVKVNVLPAVPASPPPAPMRQTTVHAASTESPFRWTAPEVAESNSTVHSSDPPAGTTDPALHILTPCILLVLLLILLTVVLFRRMTQRRNKALEGAPGQREKNFHPYRLVPGNTPSPFVTSEPAASCKAAICMPMEETPDSAADEDAYENVIHETQASRSTEEVAPGTVKFPTSHQQTIYANMNPNTRSRTSPSRHQGKRGKKNTG
ncbi:CMRF35-like molecule 5 [Trachemys scripta elegans]|uniref:CMRF35-like molecule 5 n=1 Tax=Trachemys scripta elegans TaxID=31138 RepID=UPI001552EBCF|nr:CMRF35-like molecule 5 [Trachemys scripta elegans]